MPKTDGFATRLLLRLLGGTPTIRIEVSPEALQFASAGQTMRIPAHAPAIRSVLPKAFQRMALLPAGLVPLFPSDTASAPVAPGDAAHRYDLLLAAFRGGITAMMEPRRIKLRPQVVIAGADHLDAYLHGFQYELLRRAAFDAGARTVAFEDPKRYLPDQIRLPQLDPRLTAR